MCMRLFLVDSNFSIQAHRATYPIDVVPSFWQKIKELAHNGNIQSIDKVRNEIFDKSSHQDALKAWCSEHLPDDFFLETSIYIDNYARIVRWVNTRSEFFTQNAIDEFLSVDLADPWLVATSMDKDVIIVTQEKSEPYRKSKIKIPEVCNQFQVDFVDTIGMLRRLNEKF